MNDSLLYTTCECTVFSHSARYSICNNDKSFPPELSIELCINDYDSFWKRLKLAFNFIFKRYRYGVTEVSLIRRVDTNKIINFIKKYNNYYDKWFKK